MYVVACKATLSLQNHLSLHINLPHHPLCPETLKQLVAYPAYSYLTTILIVSADATLGDALKGFWHALYACVQVLSLTIFSLQLIGPAHFTSHVIAAVAVAVSAFVVALPEGTNLMCKRIVFGQIVIVYVGTAIHSSTAQPDHDQDDKVLMHPIQVASSTMLGALASVLAMLFPNLVCYYEASFLAMLSPHLGSHQVYLFTYMYTTYTCLFSFLLFLHFLFWYGYQCLICCKFSYSSHVGHKSIISLLLFFFGYRRHA